MISFFRKILGDSNKKELAKLQSLVDKINELEKKFEKFSNEEIRQQTKMFKERLGRESLDDLLPEAFAVVREASKRTIGERHFDVQLLGGMVLHQGKIAEMKTGEGKTLVATLPVYLNALKGKGVHVVTVNDYLARRDAEWMGNIYSFLGLSVGCLNHDASYLVRRDVANKQNREGIEVFGTPTSSILVPCSRKEAYLADVTYGTNNEFGFDYLRDNMAGELEQMVQRSFNFAIVDEVDSILIDEARTPLIISAPDAESTKMYEQFSRIVPQLKENEDYNVDEKMRAVTLTNQGIDKVEKILGIDNIYEHRGITLVHHLEQALRAHALFYRDKDYVIKDGQVVIVDEFTGRLMPGRRYSEGLHQAIEAKEGVAVQQESKTLATITFQNYFRLYKKLSGMTGTAATSAEEFNKVYGLDVIVIPTNKPMIRKDLPDVVYKNEKAKFRAVVEEIKRRNKRGQPVLVGTIAIEKSEILSNLLKREGVPHEVLNAKHHEKEATIVAKAGERGAVTISTNMAGRGTDIKLGKGVVKLGGLHVIGTERHEARRIDNQLRGRAGRQGDPGSSQFFVSLDDDVMRIFGGEKIKGLMERLNVPEDQPIENRLISKAIEAAQAKVEGFHFDARKHVLEYDDVMNRQREAIYKKRREILEIDQKLKKEGKTERTLKELILEMLKNVFSEIVSAHTFNKNIKEWNIEEICEATGTIMSIPQDLRQKINCFVKEIADPPELRTKIIDYLMEIAKENYLLKEKETGGEMMRLMEKAVLLRSIDSLWIEHLDEMDHLRVGIGLRGYGQRDPLIEYKKEGFAMFEKLLKNIQLTCAHTIFKVTAGSHKTKKEMILNQKKDQTTKTNHTGKGKIGRNAPCPCGARRADGRPVKYKHCHGKNV